MNKITSLFSLAGLLALTSCTLDPVTDINAMEEAVLPDLDWTIHH
jgi:hypothetical protein